MGGRPGGWAYINPRNMSTVRLMGGLLRSPHVNALHLSTDVNLANLSSTRDANCDFYDLKIC